MQDSFEASMPQRSRAGYLSVLAVVALVASGFAVVTLTGATASTPTPVVSLIGPRHEMQLGTVALTIQTTNPLQYTLVDEYYILGDVYSFLLNSGPNWQLEPDLAVQWAQTNANPSTWEFHLSHNAYFADPRTCTSDSQGHLISCGTSHPVTGADVKFTYDYVKKNGNKTSYFASYSEHIAHVDLSSDPYFVRVVFDSAYAPAVYNTLTVIPILPQYIWSPGGSDVKVDWSNALPIGSGPFMVRAVGTTFAMVTPPPLILDRNPIWHGKEVQGRQVFPDTIFIQSYTASGAMALDLTLGKIDFAIGPSPQDYKGFLSGQAGITRQAVSDGFEAEQAINVLPDDLRAQFAAISSRPLNLGHTNPLLLNQTVRTAIHMATNRTKMIQNALLGLGTPGDTLMPESSPLWYPMPPYSPDDKNGDGNKFDFPPFTPVALEQFPEGDAADLAARTMLVQAGWAYDCATGNLQNGTEFPLCKAGRTQPLSFRFSTFNTEPWWETAARGVIADAAKAGIQFTLELLNGAQMYNLWYRLDYDVWLWDWVWTPITDTSGFLIVQTCHGIKTLDNDNGFCQRDANGKWTFDDLYNQTLVTTDRAARRALSDQAQKIIYSYASYNLPFYRDELYAYNQIHFTNFVDFAANRAVPIDIGNSPIFGQTVYPVDDKPPQFTLPAFEGVVGQPVQFSAAAIDPQGGPLRYRWDFDAGHIAANGSSWVGGSEPGGTGVNNDGIVFNDDQGGSVATPTWTYGAEGTYDIVLRVNQDGGDFFTVQHTTVTIRAAATGSPKISGFAFSPFDPTTYAGDAATLAVSASDPAGLALIQYSWNWGDGSPPTTTTVPTASHQYTTPGTYTAQVTVKNSALVTATSSTIIPVVANVAPALAPLQSQAVQVNTPQSFAAFASDPNTRDVLTYAWDFGDGTTGMGNPVTHTYTTSGATPTLTVTVSDGHGHSVPSAATINVVASRNTAPSIRSLTSSPSSTWTTMPVQLTANVSDAQGNPLLWQWDFNNDGIIDKSYITPLTSPGQPVIRTETYQYTTAGTAKAKLTITDQPPTGQANKTTFTTVTISVAANTAPTLTDIAATPSAPTTGQQITFAATSHDANGDSLAYTWDWGDDTTTVGHTPFFGGTITATHAYSKAGQYDVVLAVNDGKGGVARKSILVTVSGAPAPDTTPPVTTATVSGTSGTNSWYLSAVTVTLSATDDSTGVASTEYRIGAGAWQTYAAPFSLANDGIQTVYYRSTDGAGNVETAKTQTVKIDTVPPSASLSLSGTKSGSWYVSAVTASLSASDATSGVASISYRLDNASWHTYAAPFTVGDGKHVLDYNATDVAGWQSGVQSTAFSVDTTAPTTTAVLSGTQGNNGWYTSAVTVALSATDAGSGTASIAYRVDGGAWQTYTQPFVVSGEGAHVVEFNATDNLGHQEASKSASFQIDTSRPSVQGTPSGTVGGEGWYVSAVTITIAASDATSGMDTISYSIDGGNTQGYNAPFIVTADGVHTVGYEATDKAGLTTSGTLTVKIDTTAPISIIAVQGTAGQSGWFVSSSTTASLTASDAGSGTASIAYRVDGGAWQTYTQPFVVSGEGGHTVEYRATDRAGLQESIRSVTVKIDTTPPVLSGLGPTGSLTTSTVTVVWTASDATSGIARYEVSVDGGGFQSVGTNASFAATFGDGEHTVRVRAADQAGNTIASDVRFRVDTNLFSLSGPYSGIPTFVVIILVGIGVAAAVRYRRGKKRTPPPKDSP